MKKTIIYLTPLVCCLNAFADWSQWTIAVGGNGHYYQAVSVPGSISWFSAEAQAESMGGTLATITSAAENDFVHSLIASNPAFWETIGGDTRGVWLGGYQPAGSPEPGGGWTWVTGEAFSYQNWASAEPNDTAGGGTSNYIQYFGRGPNNCANTWNDIWPDAGAGQPLGFIVEVVPEPGVGALLGLGLGSLLLRRRGR